MPSLFFKIDTTDLSAYVDVQNYAVNQQDVYEEWEDGNWTAHRRIARTRCFGSFRLGFSSAAGFSAFVSLLSTKKNVNGYYPVTAYVNNVGGTRTFNAFLDVVNEEDKWDAKNSRQWQVCSVTLTEV
jgi:hypothetical protein